MGNRVQTLLKISRRDRGRGCMGHLSTRDSAGNGVEPQIHSIQGGPEPQSWNSRGSSSSVLPPWMRETLHPREVHAFKCCQLWWGRGCTRPRSWQVCSPKSKVSSATWRGAGCRGQGLKPFHPSPACRQHLPSVTGGSALLCSAPTSSPANAVLGVEAQGLKEGEDSSHTHKEEDLIRRTNSHIFYFPSFLTPPFPRRPGLLPVPCVSSMDYTARNHSQLFIAHPPTFHTECLAWKPPNPKNILLQFNSDWL